MIARNILRVAPEARIYDAPLLPTRIDDVETYTAHAELLFESIQYMVRHAPVAEGPWLIVNAWAVADTASEHGTGSYSARRDHRLNSLVAEMSARDKIGFVFAAGNNGQFGGDSRNGSYDIGPGRSILGANGLPEVLTVGAVRVDGLWIGSSSQGPAPAGLLAAGTGENQKPDLCAPSWFAEDEARDVSNTGTSAAAGLAGGLAALLWSEAPQLTPAELFAIMRAAAARGALLPSWSPRYGHGLAAAPPDLRSWAYA
jgi:subtilisin family serine protease